MKLLLVADLHYSLKQWDWLVDSAPFYDIVVIAGDLLDIGSIVPFEAQIVVVRKYLERVRPKRKLLVSSGNHDVLQLSKTDQRNADWLQSSRSHLLKIDNDSVEIESFYFTILPWSDTEASSKHTRDLLEKEKANAKGKTWVWVHHAPPSGSPTAWDGHADMGDTNLPGLIDLHRPKMVFCGHIHQAPFYAAGSWNDKIGETWVFNSGHQIGRSPTATVIDLIQNTAQWFSMEENDEVDLS